MFPSQFSGHTALSDLSLWYTKPAEKWLKALPIGNGNLGGMIFGVNPVGVHLSNKSEVLTF